MSRRVLSWVDLAEIAVKYAGEPDRRAISLAGVPARVKKSLATDAGFYVHSLDQQYADTKWALKLREHMLLLRQLVDAGQVTIEEPEPAPEEQGQEPAA